MVKLPEKVFRPRLGEAKLSCWEERPPSTVEADSEWVYGVLVLTAGEVEPKDAPGPGAWGLYCWVRSSQRNMDKFYEGRVLSGKMKGGGEVNDGKSKGPDKQVRNLRALLRRHGIRPKAGQLELEAGLTGQGED